MLKCMPVERVIVTEVERVFIAAWAIPFLSKAFPVTPSRPGRLPCSFARVANLRSLQKAAGLSQSQLAKASGVGLRSIQLYEQRQKDINKAHAIALYRLSRALRCTMEQLLER